jgi:hypothetical protein
MAQTPSSVAPVRAQAVAYEAGERTGLGCEPGIAPGSLLLFNRDGQAVCEDSIFSVNRPSNSGEEIVPGQGLPTDLNRKDVTSSAMPRGEGSGLHALALRSERPADMAFLKAAPQSRSERNAMRDKVAPIILSLAVHAAVTWDAQSTNHFFHHCPNGFRPAEVDPLMRPFAGKALMYPMANLLFAAPNDLLLLKTRHDRKPIRVLTYAAASIWAGLEMRQSIVNIRNQHVNSATGAERAEAIGRTH